MAKKVLKKKDNFIKDCLTILEKNPDLDNLFSKLDDILACNINNKIDIEDLYNSITILGGKEFTSVTTYLLGYGSNPTAIDLLVNKNVDERLIQKYKFLLSKYGNIIHRELVNLNNEYGWKKTKIYSCELKSNWRLAIELELNNGSQIFIRDDPESIVELVENIVEGLVSIKKHTKINNADLDSLKEKMDILVNSKLEDDD